MQQYINQLNDELKYIKSTYNKVKNHSAIMILTVM